MSVAFTRQKMVRRTRFSVRLRIVFLVLTGLEETTESYSASFPKLFPYFRHIL